MLKNLNNNLLTKIFKYKRNLSKFKSFQNTIDEKLIEKNFKTKENVARLPFGTIRHDIDPVIINSKNFNLNDSHIKNVKNVVNKNLKLDMDLEKEFDQDCMYNEEETDENAFNFDKKDEYSNEKIIKKIRYHDPLQQMKKHGNFEKIKKIEKIKWATIKKQKNHLIHDDEINISETNLINNIFDMVKQNSVKNMDFEALDSILQDAVVFQNDTMGWVAINKPYGLPLYKTKSKFDLSSHLPSLSKKLKINKLSILSYMHDNCSGIVLLASSKNGSDLYFKLLVKSNITFVNYVITNRVPPRRGVIETQLTRKNIKGSYKMVSERSKPIDSNSFKIDKESNLNSNHKYLSETSYSIIDDVSNSVALVECIDRTSIPNQIRSHMSDVLKCPLLGDHKYSRNFLQNINPYIIQKIPEEHRRQFIKLIKPYNHVLNMTIHLSQDIKTLINHDSQNLIIKTSLPSKFCAMLKFLKLNKNF